MITKYLFEFFFRFFFLDIYENFERVVDAMYMKARENPAILTEM